MADTTYIVLTKYDVDASEGQRGLEGFAIALDHVINLIERAKRVVERLIEIDAAAESAQIAMAGLMNAAQFPGAADFNNAMLMSSATMNIMRKDAAALSGTYEQMQNIFQSTIPVAREAGKSLMESEKLSGRLMEFGNTFQISPDFVGREFRQMMEGRASVRNALFKDLSMFMGGMSGQQFNALGEPEKWKKVEDALQHFDPMFQRVGATFRAQATTAESYLNQLLRIGSGTMFEGLKGELKKINKWYEDNQASIDAWVKKIGELAADKMAAGFRVIRDAVAFIVEHREALLRVAEAFIVLKGFGAMGGGGVISGRGKEAPGFGQVLGGGMFGLTLASMSDSTNAFTRTMMTATGALGTLPGAVGAVSQGLLGLQFALQTVADWINDQHEKEVKLRGEMGDPVSIYKRFEAGGSQLNAQTGGDMAAFLESHKLLTKGRIDKNKIMSYAEEAVFQQIFDQAGARAFVSLALRAGPYLHQGTFGPAAPTPEQRAQQMLLEHGKPVTVHNTTMTIYQHNTIYESEDAARVVSAITKGMQKMIDAPSQSPHHDPHLGG